MKIQTYLLLLTILFFETVQAQTIREFKKDFNVSNDTETIFELTDQTKSHYANGVNFPLSCLPFYLVHEKDHYHILAKSANEIIHEEFTTIQAASVTSFQPENSSTWILSNSKEWVVFNLDLIRINGWAPIRILKSEIDSIYLLNEGHFLTLKGNRKWHNSFDTLNKLITNEVFFEGNSFINYYGGLIVPIKEGDFNVYRYLQYQQFLFWDEGMKNNIDDPHFNYLKPDGYFKADEIIIAPTWGWDSNCNSVIELNNELKVYSFGNDSIIEDAITQYFQLPMWGILIFTDNYIAFGNEWKRIPCNKPKTLQIQEDGDFLYCTIILENGNNLKIEIPSGEIIN